MRATAVLVVAVAVLAGALVLRGAGDPTPPATGTAPGVLSVITITPGDRGVILLEWTGGPENATRWQYRQQGPENDWVWTAWADIPKSGASTRSHRVTGLRDFTSYYFQVRVVVGGVGTVLGATSPEAEGGTPEIDSHGIPMMNTQLIVEGGREWRVAGGLAVISVPSGTRLMSDGGGRIYDIESGSWFNIDIGTGEVLSRQIVTPQSSPDASWWARHTQRDVGVLFDWIAASARVLPPTSN